MWRPGCSTRWRDQRAAGPTSELRALLGRVGPDVRYEDVPTTAAFVGHAGIREMCEAAHQWCPELQLRVITRQTDGRMFAFETEVRGTSTATVGVPGLAGRPFVLRGVSVGRFTDVGLVSEQRDYGDLGSYLSQVGAQ